MRDIQGMRFQIFLKFPSHLYTTEFIEKWKIIYDLEFRLHRFSLQKALFIQIFQIFYKKKEKAD